MATYTTNFDLVKPAGSDSYDIDSFHNGSMDKIDSALQGLGSGMAIIAKNNTHAAVTSGQYVYVHGHGSLAEGLYKATANIAANGTLSGSNLSAVSNGLGGEVAALNGKITNYATGTITRHGDTGTGGTFEQFACYKLGNVVNVAARLYNISLPASGNFFVIPTGFRPKTNSFGFGTISVNNVIVPAIVTITASGNVVVSYSPSQTLTQVGFSATFPIEV